MWVGVSREIMGVVSKSTAWQVAGNAWNAPEKARRGQRTEGRQQSSGRRPERDRGDAEHCEQGQRSQRRRICNVRNQGYLAGPARAVPKLRGTSKEQKQ